jgi:hypothetical protein
VNIATVGRLYLGERLGWVGVGTLILLILLFAAGTASGRPGS